ncbi:MAG: Tat pathway signal protein [Acidobacteria bacterium]|nr:Tat pathway signal protein [Acidobacteriota bacterium]
MDNNSAVSNKPDPKETEAPADVTKGRTFLAEFTHGGEDWKVYEDLQTREGPLVFVSSKNQRKVMPKTAEPTSAEGKTPYLGLTLEEIAGALPDLLARRILEKGGDPDPELVKSVVPPFEMPAYFTMHSFWTNGTFISTKECFDTQPVRYNGETNTFTPTQYCPEIEKVVERKGVLDGLVGGWLPVIRKVYPLEDGSYCEIITFPDVERRERFTVHTWHRVAHIEGRKISKVLYRHSYRPFKPRRQDAKPEAFYRALLASAEYWTANLEEFSPTKLPQQDWVDMAKHSFVKEMMTRPGGINPRYGAIEREYAGSEHDGFPNTFTNGVYANLEWGRFATAKAFIENYFDEFVEPDGLVMYRGPETGQYGLMLALMAKYYRYTHDNTLLFKYRAKVQAITSLLTDLHDVSLQLPSDDPSRGLIHGWSEADSCFYPDPDRLRAPYFGNSAFAARGFKELGRVWIELARTAKQPRMDEEGRDLSARSNVLRTAVISGVERSVRQDMNPPYVGALPGRKQTLDEAAQSDPNGPQTYSIRAYMELLQADVLPPNLANLIVDCLLAYGGTTLGVPGGARDVKNQTRYLYGFTTYGYVQALLRLERIEEFLLFLYAHRYHLHARGHWTAAEGAGIARGPNMVAAPYCIPAQQAVPLLIRWMLVLEDSDEERLYLGRGVPRAWVASGDEISIQQAPTRWGRVRFNLTAKPDAKVLLAVLELAKPGAPREFRVTFRVPETMRLQTVTVNGRPASFSGPRMDTVVVESGIAKDFEILSRYS